MVWRSLIRRKNSRFTPISPTSSKLLPIRRLFSFVALFCLAVAIGIVLSVHSVSNTKNPAAHLASAVSGNSPSSQTTQTSQNTQTTANSDSSTSTSNSQTTISNNVNSANTTSPSDNVSTQLNVSTNSNGTTTVQGQVTNNGQTTNLPTTCPSNQVSLKGNIAVTYGCEQYDSGSNSSSSVVQLDDNVSSNSITDGSP